MAGESLRALQDDPKFQALSPEAKKIVVENLAPQDQEFSRLTAPAQDLVKSRLTGMPPADISMTNTFVQGAKEVGGTLADKFGLTSKGPIESIANLAGVEDPGAVARFPDYAIKGLVAPFVGVGEAAKDITELGGAGVARLGRAVGVPFPEEATRPQETILSQGVGTAAEVASGFGPRMLAKLPGMAAPEARFGLQTPRQRVPPVAATDPLEGAARPGLGPALAEGQMIPDTGLRSAAVPSLEQAAQTMGATITTGRVPSEILTPTLRQPIHRRVVEAAGDVFTEAGVAFDPNPARPLYLQVADAFRQGKIPVETLTTALERRGISFTEFSDAVFAPHVKDSAQTLQALSVLSRRLREAGVAATGPEFQRLTEAATQLDEMARAAPMWSRASNAWRGALVTQLSTAVRNAVTQGMRVGLDVMEKAVDSGLQRALNIVNPESRITTGPTDGMEAVLNLFRHVRTRRQTDAILRAFPNQQDRMFNTYVSDVLTQPAGSGLVRGTADRAMRGVERGVYIANAVNRFQEWSFRRAVFQAQLAQRLRTQGQDLTEMIRSGRVAEIPEDMIREALDKALRYTFASEPTSQSGKAIIRAINSIPGAALVMPFPRFLMNSLRFFFDYSPLGFTRLLSPAERAAVAAGRPEAISRALMGTAMLGAAYDLRGSKYAGHKWYEARTDEGKTIDMRPFNPFSSYLFAADIMRRYNEGRLDSLTGEDIAKGILSVNVRSGIGLALVDKFLSGIGDEENMQKAKDRGKAAAGDILAGYLTPVQQIVDAMAEFDESLKVVRDTRSEPFLGPMKARIPGLAQTLPEAQSPTRAGPMLRERPMLKQLSGLIVSDPKNPLEQELDRLGFERRHVLPSTGDHAADALIAKHMGPLAERALVPLVQGAGYKGMTEKQQGLTLSKALESVRSAARRQAEAEAPRIFARLQYGRIPQRERRVLEEAGVTPPGRP